MPALRAFLSVCLLLALTTALAAAELESPVPRYIGSSQCSDCHQEAAAAWQDSHHAWAWKPPDTEAVLGDFDDAVLDHGGVVSRFFTRDGRYVISTDGPDGTLADFEVVGTAGVEPLQQYLVETEPGRLQALDLAWDNEARRWYHLYPDQRLQGGDGLHWTGPYKTWNARCAECHATGYEKNYDPRTRRYASTQAEIGVGCEACHGPGEAHVAWARVAGAGATPTWPGLTPQGLTLGFSPAAPEREIQLCAGCHSRREAFGDGNPLPGTAYHDAYRLALLRDRLYHADGAIRDEVYVYGSFLQSKMYAEGVRCSDCHDPHAARLKATGNAVCAQCHSPAGNDRFPGLRKAVYDDPAHHFHEPGSDGAQCKSCHMIERVYMGVDGRRDHSFRVPRPDLSGETGAPNACSDCHGDRDAAWAAGEIAARFPDSALRGPHFSQVLAAARQDPLGQIDGLLDIAADDNLPGIVRASALELLSAGGADAATRSAALLRDADPLVREAAVGVQIAASPDERLERLLPALSDEYAAVRIAAARNLIGTPSSQVTPEVTEALQSAAAEWHGSLGVKMDFPEIHLVIGGAALVWRNPTTAEQAFREAVRQDPQLVDAWVMLVRIRAALGDRQGARDALGEALSKNPDDPILTSLQSQL